MALALLSTQVSAQRVFKTIKPTEVDETLKFDVNIIPVSTVNDETPRQVSSGTTDLNFSPNVVFSPDSTKGFVSFPGTDKIMVFDPKTGEILSLLEVGLNPGQLTITPDGSTVMALCLLLARNVPQGDEFEGEQVATLAAIDVETLEVRTLDLTQVWFSFFNNIVISPDSHTAYVASMRTDEILRFDIDTLTEIEPRLKLRDGGWPAAITMAADASFMAVVLTNSPSVDRLKTPDAIAFVNPETFSVTRTLSPPTGTQEEDVDFRSPQDFTGMNAVALSSDGKYGAIGDLVYSSNTISVIPEGIRDRVWVFDVESGEFALYLAYGPAMTVAPTPDGRFVVIGALYYTFIDPENQESGEVAPLLTLDDFLPRNNPVFSADGTLMYVAAPLYDRLVGYNLKTREFPSGIAIGGPVEVSDTVTLTSAPLQLQFTPDHEVLVSVNFNANTLDLIENTTRFSFARVVSNEDFFTGLALTNPSDKDSNVIITGYNTVGAALTDDAETEDVVEYLNPQEVTIPGGHQLAETAAEAMTSAPDQTISGWFDVDSDVSDLRGFSLIGDRALKRLDGVAATHATSVKYLLPEVRVTDGFDTELIILNPNLQTSHVEIELFNSAGESLATASADLTRRSVMLQFLRDPDPEDSTDQGIFAESVFEDYEDGYIVLTMGSGVIALERYYDPERMSVLRCTPIAEEDPQPTEFILPQIVEFQGSETVIKLVNSHPVPPEPAEGEDPVDPETLKLTVQLSLKRDDGQDLVAPVSVDLEAGQSIRRSVAELFGLEDTGTVVSGWILAEVNQPGLVGSAEFQVYDGKGMSTVPLQSAPSSDMVFSHVAEGLGLSTGLVLVNSGAQDAAVTVKVFDKDGQLNATNDLQVPAGGRIAGLLPDLIPGLGDQIGGYVTVHSDADLVGLELFYADNLEYIAAVEAQ